VEAAATVTKKTPDQLPEAIVWNLL